MKKEFSKTVPVFVFIIAALGLAGMFFFPMPWNTKKDVETYQTRIIIPPPPASQDAGRDDRSGGLQKEDDLRVKIPLKETEIIVAVLTDSFEGNIHEEQFIAYRSLPEIEGPVYLSYIAYDNLTGAYRQAWTAPSSAMVSGTIALFTEDIIGDRSLCILLTGMNSVGEHTLTIFRKKPDLKWMGQAAEPVFVKIAELRNDGPISIVKTERTQAYRLGITNGASFAISAYSRDRSSANIMDQVEYLYTYDESKGVYTEKSTTRVPGIQIEQRKVRELLGNLRAFEEFISGLWYFTSPQGTIDSRQYIYFDPSNREIIFYGDDTQQVFTWQKSNVTRYGLYISSQNISVTTLRRYVDISLESLDSINIKAIEGLRLKFGISAPWDGLYRKAGPLQTLNTEKAQGNLYIDAAYDSSIGKIIFYHDGSYQILSVNGASYGKYTFFYIDDREIMELRLTESRAAGKADSVSTVTRETYLVTSGAAPGASYFNSGGPAPSNTALDSKSLRKNIYLEKIRIGAHGIEKLHEGAIALNLSE